MPRIKTRPAPRQAPRAGAGRKRFEHPFKPMAERIHGQTDARTGAPLAAVHAFTVTPDGPSLATLRQRFRRQLTRMGKEDFNGAVFPLDIYGPLYGTGGTDVEEYELVFWHRR